MSRVQPFAAAKVVIVCVNVLSCSEILGLGDYRDPPPAGVGGVGGVGGAAEGGSPATGGGEPRPLLRWGRLFPGGKQVPGAIGFGSDGRIVFGGTLEGSIELQGSADDGCAAEPHPVGPSDGVDPFVAAVDDAGCAVWSHLYASSEANIEDLATSGAELWIAGIFSGELVLDSAPLDSASGFDVFWANLDDELAGSLVAAAAMMPSSLRAARIAAAPSFAVAVGGTDTDDILVQRIDGEAVWASLSLGSTGYDQAHGVAIVPGDQGTRQMVLGGEVGASLSFGDNCDHTVDDTDAFVVKLLANDASCIWSRVFGGAGDQRILALAVDGDGRVVVGGTFTGEIDFGDGTVVQARNQIDAFVAKLDELGNRQWHVVSDGIGNEIVSAVAITSKDNVAVVGEHTLELGFGIAATSASPLEDGFLMLLDAEGERSWHALLEDGGPGRFVDVAADGGTIAALGVYEGTTSLLGWTFPAAASPNLVIASFVE